MGRTISYPYRLEIDVLPRTARITCCVWKSKEYGRPTVANLQKHVAHFTKSLRPGGVNAHLQPLHPVAARIVRQSTGETVAHWKEDR